MKTEWSVSKEDVVALATYVSEDWLDYDDHLGDHCRYCNARENRDGSHTHKPDCLVLVAQDVLTGVDDDQS